MKSLLCRSLFASILFCLLVPVNSHSADNIRLTNGEWPPYLSKHLKNYGVVSQIVSEAFALEGIQVEYGFFPWTRSLMYAKVGKWDGSIIWFKTPEREKDFLVSDPVITNKKVFFHRKDKPFSWSKMEDLKNLTIGITRGYTYGNEFDSAEQSGLIKVARFTEDQKSFELLIHNRINIFPMELDVGYHILKTKFKPSQQELITHNDNPLLESTLHLLLSKNQANKTVLDKFNNGLKKLIDSGRYKTLLAESRRQ